MTPKKMALLLEGGNETFYRLKNEIKNHITLASGKTHYEALQVSNRQCAVKFVTFYFSVVYCIFGRKYCVALN